MAIARDSQLNWDVAGPTTTDTHSVTNTAGTLMLVAIRINAAESATSMTYNGVSLSKVTGTYSSPNALNAMEWWYLVNPATGANNLVTNWTTSTNVEINVQTYTGAKLSGIPDSSNTGSSASASTLTISTTVVASNCWLIGFFHTNGGTPTAGTGFVLWPPVNDGAELWGDSNGIVGTGSQSMTCDRTGNGLWNGSIFSIAPLSVINTSSTLMMLGCGS